MPKKSKHLGLKEAFSNILNLLCYAYYVKSDNIVSDKTFDELEKLYCLFCDEKYSPNSACEREEHYSYAEFLYTIYLEKN